MSRLNKSLSVFLAIVIAAVLGYIAYLIVTPKKNEQFTEFYVLSSEGNAENYPRQVVLGNTVEVILGIINHEQKPTSYRVEIRASSMATTEVNVGTLANGEKWQHRVSFMPEAEGEEQIVEFYLYVDGEREPYLKKPLRLSLDVVPP